MLKSEFSPGNDNTRLNNWFQNVACFFFTAIEFLCELLDVSRNVNTVTKDPEMAE